ncbi:hypothetical protein BY996DRAFT_6417128 [Phakopsora pachyrhizi]|nr:hypothetical protein BY996DRAFT_6417128 [Phakopsora pachyrhizi]
MIISSDTEEGAQSQIKQGLEKLMNYSSFITLSAEIGATDWERRSRINDLNIKEDTKNSGLGMAGGKPTGEDRSVGVTGHFHCLCHCCCLFVIGLGTFLNRLLFWTGQVLLQRFCTLQLFNLLNLGLDCAQSGDGWIERRA